MRTNSGLRTVTHRPGGLYTVEMGAPEWRAEEMGLAGLRGRVLGRPLEFEGESRRVSCVAVGNVHCVQFVPDTTALRLEELGPRVAYAGWFPSGANAGFAQLCGENELRMRVYERGSKETLACGHRRLRRGSVCVGVGAVHTGQPNSGAHARRHAVGEGKRGAAFAHGPRTGRV